MERRNWRSPGRAPDRMNDERRPPMNRGNHDDPFDDLDDFMDYLDNKVFAGDALHIWSFASLCKEDNTIASGKYPDEKGCVPKKGAY